MPDVVYTSSVRLERRRGPLRIAYLPGESNPVTFSVHGAIAEQPASARLDRLRVAIVCVNGQGAYNMNEVYDTKLVEIVALSDVDESRAAAARKRFPKANFYTDYRRMLDQ